MSSRIWHYCRQSKTQVMLLFRLNFKHKNFIRFFSFTDLSSEERPKSDNNNTEAPPPYSERRPLLWTSKPQANTAIPVYGGAPFLPAEQSALQYTTREPKDYLTLSILTTIFCCCSIGILAIVKSCRAREAIQTGEYSTCTSTTSVSLQAL